MLRYIFTIELKKERLIQLYLNILEKTSTKCTAVILKLNLYLLNIFIRKSAI